LREHQAKALQFVRHGLASAERGKLIMACGTGKTFTSLKIAEELVGKGGRVLFLVPSLALLSQTLTEWTQESTTPLNSFAVCSDADVGKKRTHDEDKVQTFTHELRYPATTDAQRLSLEMTKRHDAHHMSVVFSTYHSIDVISEAQKTYNLADFDLIICDEAHRTTGATFDNEDESNFVKVHNNEFLKATKRLYMTATPRIYGENAKKKSDDGGVVLCSMDDEALYGKELYVITFSEAVSRGLLVDYKVIVLTVNESDINRRLGDTLKAKEIIVDDAAKIVGCWKALSKQDTREDLKDDADPMRRAVAFCQVIEYKKGGKVHKVSSKQIAKMFGEVIEAYKQAEMESESFETELAATLKCHAEHVDGSMNASEKEAQIQWLKQEPPRDTCHILSNVRCLSEGVDVPALDAVLFLTPRGSQVDVVQSVGRVMRNAPNKKRGYVILPVVIPAGVEAHQALNDNKTYKVVWEVLQALRSHDDRFDALINKMDLELNTSMLSKMEVIAITEKVNKKSKKSGSGGEGKPRTPRPPKGTTVIGGGTTTPPPEQTELEFEIGEIERAIYAKVVQKCGNRHHWVDWANDIAKIARTHIDRIKAILENPDNASQIAAFTTFAEELRDDLNGAITDDEVIEMLAQHLITKPVFDALFEGYSFAEHNPMSQAMQQVLETLQEHNLQKEADTLTQFYESVKMRAAGITSAEGKQKIIIELYDKFFRNAFPKMTERLGIVYTPTEVVDFIIHSVNDILKSEFNQTLGSPNVHIIDPFTGTGTFITRLLQSGLITPEQLTYKYKNEIHANEIVLLAYYIAAINIESTYHDLMQAQQPDKTIEYEPFEGICLTDTFQMYEKEDLIDQLLVDNSKRRKRQKALDIRVIVGNPPYSAGQESANDNNANVAYPHLDEAIRSTYATRSTATNKNALYDSYIRAIRWASDRIKEAGVIGFVTNAGFVEANTADGLRKCLAQEFSNIYIFHLRGNQRTSGELSRKEGGKIFGSGSRAPIAISLLVKNPKARTHGNIYFHDIGDYLSQQDKLEKIAQFQSIAGITHTQGWQAITPDKYGDWINQRDDSFGEYISLGSKKNKNEIVIFSNYSSGVKTGRDAWCYNSSKLGINKNVTKMIDFYNSELLRTKGNKELINFDTTKISWGDGLKLDIERKERHQFCSDFIKLALYRPFQRQWMYYDRSFNERVYQMPVIKPLDKTVENRIIYISGLGGVGKYLSALMVDIIPDLNMQHSGGQGFPLKLYEKVDPSTTTGQTPQGSLFGNEPQQGLFDANQPEYVERDGITDEGLAHFQDYYPHDTITKEDFFYYIYCLLHSEDYKTRYADNLTKELPRIPRVKQAQDFWTFSQAGRKLATLHLDYEKVPMYPVEFEGGALALTMLADKDFYVTKMKFGKGIGEDKHDKTTVIYNDKITMKGIPLEAYEYIVNGKPALEWVMERQGVSTHKESGIVNDANDWAIETMNNPRYPLELFQRVITVSLETMRIVNSLPKLVL
jgi:predicted helicase